jgi:menaquinone-dependent protoporphyrinogen IX oxidase
VAVGVYEFVDVYEFVGVYDEELLPIPVAFFVLSQKPVAPCDKELPQLLNVCPKESKNPPFK